MKARAERSGIPRCPEGRQKFDEHISRCSYKTMHSKGSRYIAHLAMELTPVEESA